MRKIEFAPEAAIAVERLDGPALQRLADLLSDWAGEPSPPGQRIGGATPPAYRVRSGGMRILYEEAKDVLRVMDLRMERRMGREA